ncbi:CPBP family intramembrane glutamic endopeptidase [Tessaracoccus palaemonis]|uniref:CPBP family intramembrane metalloprotease n=1 Tax=Tessaracoccus palaemonis TaxID=2829499 RepID=A0ABX8SL84_9ACTN|nr:CPBP family intramembrane glutamic endopeptidase [Tessaracoccus palaemonis]QXT63180.1 CPBP family intramembrane metalloprotease [Tessaracoccus palaemonis]
MTAPVPDATPMRGTDAWRVAPRPWIGLVIWAVYIIVVYSLEAFSGVRYDALSDSAGNLVRFGIIPLAVGSALLIATVTALGWWRPVLVDDRPVTRRWLWALPALMTVVMISNLFATRWAGIQFDYLVLALALGVCVGFAEEVLARGLLITALRARLGEPWVWFISSALFGIMHAFNAVLGSPLGTSLLQAALAFASGSVFYLLRRLTGWLWPAILLHAIWDFSQFTSGLSPIG